MLQIKTDSYVINSNGSLVVKLCFTKYVLEIVIFITAIMPYQLLEFRSPDPEKISEVKLGL